MEAVTADMVSFINATGSPVFSLDVPTGLDATTGKAADVSIKAAKTVTFGLAKTGFAKEDGPECTGEVIVRNITYPLSLLSGKRL